MKQIVKKQILKVRDTHETNMFDVNAVMRIAYDNNWHELVAWLSDEDNRKEYSRFILTGEAQIEDLYPEVKEPKDAELGHSKEEADEKINVLFHELVPSSGKADTVAGEIIRAISRIGYRSYNDGDHIGVGYGRETCNPAARYLAKNAGRKVAEDVSGIWGISDDAQYNSALAILEADVLSYIEEHPELKSVPNREDMFDYADEQEDMDDGEDGECW